MNRERCAEHDLAVGPGGECVLCRRARVRTVSGPPRWLAPAMLAGGLGTTLLGGVALARTRTSAAPVVETAAREMAPAAPHAAAVPCVPPVVETRPCEPLPETPHVSHHPSHPAQPQHNYLDEAYAAMPKENLYDEAPVRVPSTTGTSECPCQRTGGCQPHYVSYVRGTSYQQGTTRPVGAPLQPTSNVRVQHVGPAPAFARGGGRLR